MKLRWRDSVLSTSNLDEDKEYLKLEEKFLNDNLKFEGFLFLNDALKSLGFKRIKRGQYDGWMYDELESESKQTIKFRVKEENGELYLNLNEERNIVDNVFVD